MIVGWLELILGIIALLLLPAIGLLIRGAIKWTRTEAKLDTLITRVGELVRDKDKVHTEIFSQMREDRLATNQRLTYLERVWIEKGFGQK
jgi:uncharacterized membrane protein YbaN (DUF454 family)